MSDPGTAALDPIFYLHHANVDRLWARWNADKNNRNPVDQSWLTGPTAHGDRVFVMPRPDGSSWTYTPQEMMDLDNIDYTYDSIPAPPAPTVSPTIARLTRLGARVEPSQVKSASVATGRNVELVGANDGPLPIKNSSARTTVTLDSAARAKVSRSLTLASTASAPDRVFLALENVRGTHDGSVLNVYVNLPDGAKPADHPELLAGSVGLFGLRRASDPDSTHAGRGLNFTLDISRIADALHLSNVLQSNSLAVTIVPRHPVPDEEDVTVGKVSVYRQGA
jgi:tyrosinase